MNKRIVVILGMGRSGTSFLANWLHKCGVDMGENLKPADDIMNTEGFYEDVDFLLLIEYFRYRCVSAWDKFAVNEVKWTDNSEIVEKFERLVLARNNKKVWGLKILSLTFLWKQLWFPIFTKNKIHKEVLVIGAFRDFHKCIDSYMRASLLTKISPFKRIHFLLFKNRFANRYLKEWISCNLQIIDFIENNKQNNNWLLLDTKYLLESSEKIFTHLVNDNGLKIKYIDPNSIFHYAIMDRKSNIKYKLDSVLLTQANEILKKLITLRENQF
jgi:hypothetical protein